MARVGYFLLTCGLVLCVLIAGERQAYAYVDPGSGLYLLQGIGTAFVGVMYVLRRKLRIFGRSKVQTAAAGASGSESAGEIEAQERTAA